MARDSCTRGAASLPTGTPFQSPSFARKPEHQPADRVQTLQVLYDLKLNTRVAVDVPRHLARPRSFKMLHNTHTHFNIRGPCGGRCGAGAGLSHRSVSVSELRFPSILLFTSKCGKKAKRGFGIQGLDLTSRQLTIQVLKLLKS